MKIESLYFLNISTGISEIEKIKGFETLCKILENFYELECLKIPKKITQQFIKTILGLLHSKKIIIKKDKIKNKEPAYL